MSSENESERSKHGRTDAFYLVQKNDLAGLRECVAAGTDINAVDDRGDTALHWAAWNYRYEALDVLLEEFHANPNIQNHRGQTPFHHLINRKVASPYVAQTLMTQMLSHGADPLLLDHQGNTVYHALMQKAGREQADIQGTIALIGVLSKKAGCDGWYLPNEQGVSAMDLASRHPSPLLAAAISHVQAQVLEEHTISTASKTLGGRRL